MLKQTFLQENFRMSMKIKTGNKVKQSLFNLTADPCSPQQLIVISQECHADNFNTCTGKVINFVQVVITKKFYASKMQKKHLLDSK